MNRSLKRLVAVTADAVMVPFALYAALALRYGEWDPGLSRFWILFLAAPAVAVAALYQQGIYRAVVRYMSTETLIGIARSVGVAAIAIWLLAYLLQLGGFPRSAPVIFWFIAVACVGGVRMLVRLYGSREARLLNAGEPVLIYGAGEAGVELATVLRGGTDYVPYAFIDDQPEVQGSSIHGIRVYRPDELEAVLARGNVEQILLAIPSADRTERRRVLEVLSHLAVRVRSVPHLSQIVSGEASLADFRDIGVEDLLSREPVPPDRSLLNECNADKVVMVTGAGGTIGSELCRQIVELRPARLIMLELSEYALYAIEKELESLLANDGSTVQLTPIIGSVQDSTLLQRVIATFGVQTIYHAAAYKHVSRVEENVIQGVRNNVFGTYSVARAARELDVETFVLVSTDKAVRPSNIMGATKRCAELIVQYLAQQSRTRFCMVRFGNVLGSSGSVVPLFSTQIRNGGPVTVTHPDVTRYFMTISEASQLVLQAGSMARGGDVFVLDMGEPVRILDLARAMIHLMGHEVRDDDHPGGEIEISFIGLAPGEKLTEELLIGRNVSGTAHAKIFRARERRLGSGNLERLMRELGKVCDEYDCEGVRHTFAKYLEEVAFKDDIADLLWKSRPPEGSATITRLEPRKP